MRITCPSCNSDFILPPISTDIKESTSGCPFCGTEYRASWNEANPDEPKVAFGTQKQSKKLRICIECGKDYEALTEQVIPVCYECGNPKKHRLATEGSNIWKLLRGGRIVELSSDVAVREWIQQGAILPEDELISPNGGRGLAKRFPDFVDAFKVHRTRGRQISRSPSFLSKRWIRFDSILRWIGILIVAAPIGWAGYRIFTYKPIGPQWDKDLQTFISKLKERVRPLSVPNSDLLTSAKALLAKDRPDTYEEAIGVLETAVVSQPSSCEYLGMLDESYGLAPGAATDLRLRNSATSLANLLFKLCPDDVGSHLATIRSSLYAKDLSTAANHLQTALDLDPQNPRVLLGRQAVLVANAKSQPSSDEILRNTKALTTVAPELLETYDLLGVMHIERAEPLLARHAFEKRLQRAQDDAKMLYRLGQLDEYAGNWKLAKEWYEQALRQNNKLVSPRVALAILKHRFENANSVAETFLRDVLGRYQRYATIDDLFASQMELIDILSHTNRSAEALELTQHFPPDFLFSAPAILKKADTLIRTGRDNEAISLLRESATANPNEASFHLRLGELYESKSNFEEAIKSYRDATKHEPRRLKPYLLLIRLLVNQHRELEALDVANGSISRPGMTEQEGLREDKFSDRDEIHWSSVFAAAERLARIQTESTISHAFLGLCFLRAGIEHDDELEIKRSLGHFDKAVSLDKDSESVVLLKGRAFFALKNFPRARSAFEEALRLNPSSSSSHYWVGATLHAQKQFANASKALTHPSVLNDSTWAYRALNMLGDILQSQKNSKEARQHWQASLNANPSFIPPWRSLLHAKD